MVKTKFPSLYTIIKTGDLNTLAQYFEVYPETSTRTKLYTGKKLELFAQALMFKKTPIIQFLIDKTPPNELVNIIPYIVNNLKYCKEPTGNEVYQYFCKRLFNQIESTGSVELIQLIETMLYEICTCGFVVPDTIITDLLNNRLLNLKNKLQDLDFQWKFGNKMSSVSARIYKILINYYNENQLNQAQLLANYIICSYDKSEAVIKLFKSVDLKSKVKINSQKTIQVQLSNLFVVSGANAKLTGLLANPNFEFELMETMKFIDFYDSSIYNFKLEVLVNAIQFFDAKLNYECNWYFIGDVQFEYLKLFESKLSNVFWSWLLELNEKTKNKKSKEYADKLILTMIK
jgi:hypothetical protein